MKLIENQIKVNKFRTTHVGSTNNDWFWVKAYVNTDDDAVAMSAPMTCKDHLIDGYMCGNTHVYHKTDWTEKQHRENSILLVVPTDSVKPLLHHIKTVLNPYEKTHKLQRTTCTKVESEDDRNYYLVRGSQLWMSNATAFSMYATLVRLCGQTMKMDAFTMIPHKDEQYHNNDRNYFSGLNPHAKRLYTKYLLNPRPFLKVLPKTHGISTAPTGLGMGHGGAGLHGILNAVSCYISYAVRGSYTRKELEQYCKRGYFYKALCQDYIKEANVDVTKFVEVRNGW